MIYYYMNKLKYKGAAAFPVMMPIIGNSSMGRMAVAANGMASVIHKPTEKKSRKST